MENMEKQFQTELQIFENAAAAGKITKMQIEIYVADKLHPPILKSETKTDDVKQVLKRFFVMYGIDPGKQFSDDTFKNLFVNEVVKLLENYFPTISKKAFELAIELNLVNYFNLKEKPEVYGDRLTVNFLSEILNVWRHNKGKVVMMLEKLLPEKNNEIDLVKVKQDLRQLMEEDFLNIKTMPLRLPESYYKLLVQDGEIIETDEFIKDLRAKAIKQIDRMKNMKLMKVNGVRNITELAHTRRMFSGTTRRSIMMEIAVWEYAMNYKESYATH